MAKSKPSSIEIAVKRATDETLTSDNWQYNLDVCDEISRDPESTSGPALTAIIQRIQMKDANVALRALSLAVAVSQNCGSRMQHLIALRAFLQDCLLPKLAEKRVHSTVKRQIVALICQLSADFSSDPSLRPMKDAYNTVSRQYPQFLLPAPHEVPDKPEKRLKSTSEQQQEDDELKRAMALSLQEYEREKSLKEIATAAASNEHRNGGTTTHAAHLASIQPTAARQPGLTPAPLTENVASVSKVLALYDLISYEPDELSFRKGDVITVIESVYRDWWRGSLPSGQTGIFPLNYVTPIVNKSPQELEREQQMEDRILQHDARAIDELVALLSRDFSTIDEDHVTALYNQVSPLRPQLGKCIDKYNVRKEELAVLNSQLGSQLSQYNEMINKLITTAPRRSQLDLVGVPYPVAGSAVQSQLEYQPTSHGFGNALYRQPQPIPNQGAYPPPPT